MNDIYAGVAELADAQDLKSCCSNTVPVRFRSPASYFVRVAQLDRASGYGPEGRGFESFHVHEESSFFELFFICKRKKLLGRIRIEFLNIIVFE